MENANLKERILAISGVNPRKCMKCGKCSGTCPAYDEMEYHPHEFVYMVERGDVEKLAASESLYKCLTCFACVERCPRDVRPGKLIDGVRQAAVRRRGGTHLQPEDIPSRIDPDTPQQLLMSVLRRERK